MWKLQLGSEPSEVAFVEGSKPWAHVGQGIISLLNYPELTDEDVSNRLSVSCRSWHIYSKDHKRDAVEPCKTER